MFAPKPRSYRTSVNKKVKKLALKSALSAKVQDEEIFVIDNISVEEIKTKKIVGMLSGLNVEKKALIVLPENDEKIYKSARNIPGVAVAFVGTLNVYDLLKYNTLIIAKDAAEKLGEVYA